MSDLADKATAQRFRDAFLRKCDKDAAAAPQDLLGNAADHLLDLLVEESTSTTEACVQCLEAHSILNIGSHVASISETLKLVHIGDTGLEELAKQLPAAAGSSEIKILHLEGNDIGNGGTVALGAALAQGALPKLETLFASNNNIGASGVGALAVALASGACPDLGVLDLNKNATGNDGMASLGRAIVDGAGKCFRSIYLGTHTNAPC